MIGQDADRWRQAESELAMGRADLAALSYRSLTAHPEFSTAALLRLSLIGSKSGSQREAVFHALEAYRVDSSNPQLRAMVAKRLFRLWEIEALLDCVRSPIVMRCNDATLMAELGKLLLDAFMPEEAMPLLARSIQLDLRTAGIDYLLGMCHLYMGDEDQARRCFHGCLDREPNHAYAHWALSRLSSSGDQDKRAAVLQEALAAVGGDLPKRALILHAMYKQLEAMNEYEGAWRCLAQAMEIQRRLHPHDSSAEANLFQMLANIDYPQGETSEEAPFVPIFVVGMPRSGTTLLEQALAKHPQVASAGEVHDFICQLRWQCNLPGGPYLDLPLASRAAQADKTGLGQRYMKQVAWRGEGRTHLIDKMPANFLAVGMIASSMRRAKIICMYRDPVEACFSNFKEMFHGAYRYSNSLNDVARHCSEHHKLRNVWKQKFPDQVHEVRYEDLVASPERTLSETASFCGIDWDAGLLGEGSATGVVATASSLQVREEIHSRFLHNSHPYHDKLAPLLARLTPI